LDFNSGQNVGGVRVWALPSSLTPGTYTANLVVDGGPVAGSVNVPVTLTVKAGPTPTPTPGTGTGTGTGTGGGTPAQSTPQITVSSVVNAATFKPTPLVPGSLGTLLGSNLSGKNVAVTFDGNPATLLYTSAGQINLQVPRVLDSSKATSSMTVTVDGNNSTAQLVQLAPAWPSVFANGVLNQDYSPNGTAHGAKAGDVLQIWATGIPSTGTVSVNFGDRAGVVPLYAGAAPDVPGVQQVNVSVPEGVSGAVPLTICVATGGQQYCSAASTAVVQ